MDHGEDKPVKYSIETNQHDVDLGNTLVEVGGLRCRLELSEKVECCQGLLLWWRV